MTSHYSLEQRFSLVLDCYKSGLSIPSWCKEKGIAPGTFYGWIKQVANKGYDVPAFTRHGTAYKQEIVKVSVVDSLDVVPCADVFPAIENKEVLATASVITAHIGGTTVDIPSTIDQTFLSKIFKSLKECT
ncbi:MAG: IS66 family insertion sequence element accessory protein TnpA [Lachnospira sp.]